jgi:hypothetical protein
MSSETILALLLSLAAIAGIAYWIVRIKFAKVKYENKLMSILSDIISCDDAFKKNFTSEINNYETTSDTVNEIGEKTKELPFPIPSKPNDSETGNEIIGKLSSLMDEHSEQIEMFKNSALKTTDNHFFKAFVENFGSLKTIFADKTAEHNIDAILKLKTFDFSDALLDENTDGAFIKCIDPAIIIAKTASKHQPLNEAIEDYCLEYNQIVKDLKEYATPFNKVHSTAKDKQKEFLENLSAGPHFDDFKHGIIAIIQNLVKSLKEDLDDFNQELTELKNLKYLKYFKYASKPKCKKLIDDIELKISGIEKLIPSEYEINNDLIQSLHKIINIQFIINGKFYNELTASYQNLKELVENYNAKMHTWAKNINTLYENAICNIGSELNTQAENYNNKRSEWKEALKQKKERVIEEEISVLLDIISRDDNFKNDFISEINNYETANGSEISDSIIDKLGTLINNHSELLKDISKTIAKHILKKLIRTLIEKHLKEKTTGNNIITTGIEKSSFNGGSGTDGPEQIEAPDPVDPGPIEEGGTLVEHLKNILEDSVERLKDFVEYVAEGLSNL